MPKLFPIDPEIENDHIKTWIKAQKTIDFKGEKFRIKKMCFACNKNEEAPDLHQGIAVFRGGMKVDTIDFPERGYRKNVYGYVEFDKDLDKALRELEYLNHYEFRKTGIWRKVKEYLEEELVAFGNQKLGLGIDRRAVENAKRNTAENKALSIMRNSSTCGRMLTRG